MKKSISTFLKHPTKDSTNRSANPPVTRASTILFNSIQEMYQHEFTLVTKHFKYAGEATRDAVASLIVHGEPGAGVCINHACLIGYDFKGFNQSSVSGPPEDVLQDFLDKFSIDGTRLTKLLQSRFDKFDKKYIKFEVFFLPFPSVSEFRNEFNAALD